MHFCTHTYIRTCTYLEQHTVGSLQRVLVTVSCTQHIFELVVQIGDHLGDRLSPW